MHHAGGAVLGQDVLVAHDVVEILLVEAERGEAAAANTYAEAVLGVLPPDARPNLRLQNRSNE